MPRVQKTTASHWYRSHLICGVIADRNGIILARNYSAFTLEITPSKVDNLEETIDGRAKSSKYYPKTGVVFAS